MIDKTWHSGAILGSLVGLFAVTNCGAPSTCAGVAVFRVVPGDTTIRVQRSFVAQFQEGGSCGDPSDARYGTVAVTWRTPDSTVVALDSATGVITGRAVGDAHITTSRGLGLLVHVR